MSPASWLVENVLRSWFEESLHSISYEKSMSWLLRSHLFMNSKVLMVAVALESRYLGLLRLTHMAPGHSPCQMSRIYGDEALVALQVVLTRHP